MVPAIVHGGPCTSTQGSITRPAILSRTERAEVKQEYGRHTPGRLPALQRIRYGSIGYVGRADCLACYHTCRRMSSTGFDPNTVTRARAAAVAPSLSPPPPRGKASTQTCSRLMETSLSRFLRKDELLRKRGGTEGFGVFGVSVAFLRKRRTAVVKGGRGGGGNTKILYRDICFD